MSTTKSNTNKTLELVIYKIKPELINEYLKDHLKIFRNLVCGLKGFQSYRTLSSHNQKGLLVDLVEWDNINNAVAAAEAIQEMQKSKEYAGYLNSLEEVTMFHHFQPV